jgi:predicted phage tail protein
MSVNSKQIAKILDIISEGEIEGVVDGLRSVYLDDTPVMNPDGSLNHEGVSVEFRNGTQDQTYIKDLSSVEAEFAVGVEIEQGSPVTRTVGNVNADRVRVTVSVPELVRYRSDGDRDPTNVTFRFQIQSNGGGFVPARLKRIALANTFEIGQEISTNTTASDQFEIDVKWTGVLNFTGGSTTPILGQFASGTVDTTQQFARVQLQVRTVGFTTWNTYEEAILTASSTAGTDILGRPTPAAAAATATKRFYVKLGGQGNYEWRVVQLAGTGSSVIQAGFSLGYSGEDTFSFLALSKYQRSYEIDLVGSAPWDVRMIRVSPPHNSKISNRTFWDSYTEIVDAKLRYPNTALAYLVVDSEKFNSVPNRGYEIRGVKVQIPSNYNPLTRTYSGVWNGTFIRAWTNNPAWIFYDLVTNTRYGLGEYVDASLVDKWKLYEIGQYCDGMVSDGRGGLEPRFTCNIAVTTREDADKLLNNLASSFRGMVYWMEGSMTCINDAPSDPVKLFHAANVLGGEFVYSGGAVRTRNTVVLVSWNDPDDGYRIKVESVEDPEGIARYGVRQKEVTAFGATSQGQAVRYGRALLYTELYESEVVNFTCGIDHLNLVRPGAVIQIQDRDRAGVDFGGRIIGREITVNPQTGTGTSTVRWVRGDLIDQETWDSGLTWDNPALQWDEFGSDPEKRWAKIAGFSEATETVTQVSFVNQLRLDRNVTFLSNQVYSISVELPNGNIETRQLTGTFGTTNTVTPITPFSAVPNHMSMWAISSTLLSLQTFRVLTIEEKSTVEFSITAISYNSGKQNYIENNIKLSPKPTSISRLTPQRVRNVIFSESLTLVGKGVVGVKGVLSWEPSPTAKEYLVAYRLRGGNTETRRTQNPIIEIVPMLEGAYDFKVTTINAFGKTSPSTNISAVVYGKTVAPSNVTGLSLTASNGMAHISWDPTADLDVSVGGYILMRHSSLLTGALWENSVPIGPRISGSTTNSVFPLLSGTYLAKWVDSSGLESPSAIGVSTNAPDLLNFNAVVSFDEQTLPWTGSFENTVYDAALGGIKLGSAILIDDMTDLIDTWELIDSIGGIAPSGFYQKSGFTDLGSVLTSRLSARLTTVGYDEFDTIDLRNTSIDEWLSIDGNVISDVGAQVYVSTTDDNPAGTPTWSEYKPFYVGDWRARAFRFRVVLTSQVEYHNILVTGFGVTIDMPDRIASGENLVSGTGIFQVTYNTNFKEVLGLAITAEDMATGNYYTITNKTTTGFQIRFFNASGTGVSRTFDYIARGY